MLNTSFAKVEILMSQTYNMTNCQGASSHFLLVCMNIMFESQWVSTCSPSPELTIGFLTVMMKHYYFGGTVHNLVRLTQHKVQYTITTLMGSIYLG